MPEGSSSFHEDPAVLSVEAKDRHRALVSLIEELQAIDWYDQREEATSDQALAGILLHNRNEEVEHAAMLLEWLRRRDGVLAAQLARYLFSEEPITGVEQGNDAPGAVGSLGLGALAGKETL